MTDGSPDKHAAGMIPLAKLAAGSMPEPQSSRIPRARRLWSCSPAVLISTVLSTVLLFSIYHSFTTRQLDGNNCGVPGMRPGYAELSGFSTEHTRFASKYSVYLYREGVIDVDPELKGVPVLFIPGNAGSYRQVRSLAAEAAYHFHDVVQHDANALKAGTRSLDFFSVDFNEDITAFHGQTLLDQAEYLNDAIAYILSMYHDPQRTMRNPDLPDPSSVILLGHSMGGIVARTMLTMPNYQSNSVNTIITMSAPHARPPVSFDADIVKTYKHINNYWRKAYSEVWANENPLWHVTLISIAGGGLDTVVPSDYASIASLVPETHGFTVFTSSVPYVWSGMDHQAILWCDQFRKIVIRSLYDVIDVRRPSQTKPRAERMGIFKKRYLTGLEPVADKELPQRWPSTLLTLEDNSNSILSLGERLSVRRLGKSKRPRAYLMPIPAREMPGSKKFTLLTDQKLDHPDDKGQFEVLFCSVFPLQSGNSAALFSMNIDLSGESSGSTRLACKNAAVDLIPLPASTSTSSHPYDDSKPFSYLQYDLKDLAEMQFVAVVDKAVEPTPGWVIAEFSDKASIEIVADVGLGRLLTLGMQLKLPAERPMVVDITVPALHSTLLAYRLSLSTQACGDELQLFTPLLRQHMSEPYESKYFVNVRGANVNLHGMAPFMPPPLKGIPISQGVSFQLWSDPTCRSALEISLKVDMLGSVGKLWMRYRTVFAAFPLLIVALVLRQQFKVYDESGVFMSFAESMDICLRRSFPLALLALSFLALSLARSATAPAPKPSAKAWPWSSNATESAVDFTKNDLLLGSQDPFFWFLVPFFGLICVGGCVLLNFATLGLINLLSAMYNPFRSRSAWPKVEDKRKLSAQFFAPTSPRRRVITTCILLFLVSTCIPFQFAYMVACLVQIATCARAFRLANDSRTAAHINFYNYVHSVLILMLWILPINLPVLVVWIHNLAVHWLTPFSSHHNVLSVMPYLLLIETLTTGRMVPRVTSRGRNVTGILLFFLALYSAVYGVTYAYLLHRLGNIFAAWLCCLHISSSSVSLSRPFSWVAVEDDELDEPASSKKRP